MDPSLCRGHLERLLLEEIATLERLEPLLVQEHETLRRRDLALLERSCDARQEEIGKLARLDEERRSLCRMMGRAPDSGGLRALIDWCDPRRTLLPHLDAIAQRAARCKDLNDRNGALAGARMRALERTLDVMNGDRRAARTYGPSGIASSPGAGRVLSAEA